MVNDSSGLARATGFSASGDLLGTGRTSVSEAMSGHSSTYTGGRQEQLAFELALGSAAAAAGNGRGGHAAAASALADAERMLLAHGAAAGDLVLGYRWYRLCIGYAELGDEAAACRSFAAAVDGGLQKISEYGNEHPLRPRDHPVLAASLACSGDVGGSAGQMRALGLLIERFERSQDHTEQERRHAVWHHRMKTSRKMTPADLMAEGLSVDKAVDAAEQVRAMHMRRSGGLERLVDPNELPPLGPTSQLTATTNLDSHSPVVTQSETQNQFKLPALVSTPVVPAARQVHASQVGASMTRSLSAAPTPAHARGLESLSTSSDLLYLQQADRWSIRVDILRGCPSTRSSCC